MERRRIKTEQEFIKEYGKDWRNCVGWNWEGRMDYLCGKELSENEVERILKHKSLCKDYWTIEITDTVTLEDPIPSSFVESEIDIRFLFKEDPLTGFAPIKQTL